ncbi:MAG: hypothetical protein HW412_1928 [Bacteroidetes bacterium]|nr:hypothetical protein [Bacteroidota bacterium]
MSAVLAVAHPFEAARHDSSARTVRVAPGVEYDAGWLHRLLAGAHWRDLWVTEFEAEVLDLNTFAGGLTPTEKGGSLQTKNLRFVGNDGREYKFRSLNKDGKRTLPPELQESIIADIFQDQISIGNPVASVVAAPLLDTVGILNAGPRIVVLPISDRLGPFKEEFSGMLGTIEEHPKAGDGGDPGFHGADKVIDGLKVFEKLTNDNDERMDEVEFLKARLVDVLLGDRDRHADQWRWAGYKLGGKRYWRPIPRDRDFAFCRYDGLFPWAAGLFVHSAVGFGASYPSILELTWIGRHLDRRFLSSLETSVWDSVTTFIKSTLTDSVIHNALHAMPQEMYEKGGEQMFAMLKARRDRLDEAATEFYELLSDVVDVYGSNKAERVEINRLNDKLVDVSMYKRKSGALLYKRLFSNKYTNEVRIHLLGGDDVATVGGEGRSGIRIRLLGGDGDDELIDRSKAAGNEFYDDSENTNVTAGPHTSIMLGTSDSPAFNDTVPEPKLEDRYRIVRVLPLLSFNSDDGLIFGGYLDLTQYGFRDDPYSHYGNVTAKFAPRFNHYYVQFYSESHKIIDRTRVDLFASASNLGLSGFYGLGNETPRDEKLFDADFYRTNYHEIRVEPAINLQVTQSFALRFSGRYEYSNAKVTANSFLNQAKPYGLGTHSALGISISCAYDGRDHPFAPSTGFFVSVGGTYYPKVFANGLEFGKANADVRAYLPATLLSDVVFAFHVGGEKTFGKYPFYRASVIGGPNTVRGYSLQRDQTLSGGIHSSVLRAMLRCLDRLKCGLQLRP